MLDDEVWDVWERSIMPPSMTSWCSRMLFTLVGIDMLKRKGTLCRSWCLHIVREGCGCELG